jgi:voltage-gated potassium channel
MEKLRKRTYEILESARDDDPASRWCDLFLVILIVLNVIAVILESVPDLYAAYEQGFSTFETFSVMVFTVEYLLRVWGSVERTGIIHHHPITGRLRYMMTPMALLDLIVILPFFLTLLGGVDLRSMRVLRLLRVLRLTRYSSALRLLKDVVKVEADNIGAALFILMMMVVLSASLVYLAESDVQPTKFGSIPDALWWAVITVTSIGYGDAVPVTTMGKIMGSVIGIISVGMVALPTGILASGFNQALHHRRQAYGDLIDAILEDGKITEEDHDRLHDARDEMGLSDREAASILNKARHQLRKMPSECPHCGESINPLHGFAAKLPFGKSEG